MENGHIYQIAAVGSFCHPDTIIGELAKLGLTVNSCEVSYTLEQRFSELPESIPGFAEACREALEYPAELDDWEDFSYKDKIIEACISDNVMELAWAVKKLMGEYENDFAATMLTGSLIIGAKNVLHEKYVAGKLAEAEEYAERPDALWHKSDDVAQQLRQGL